MRWLIPVVLFLTACGGTETAPTPMTAPTPPAPVVAPDPARFDAGFNAQLVHDAYDHPADASQRAKLLLNSPSIYLQSSGLSAATVAAIEAEARTIVPMLTGGRLNVAAFESGAAVRPVQAGWIIVEQVNTPDDPVCGRASVGALAGHIWLNMAPELRDIAKPSGCYRPLEHTFGHELGHALGFYHVDDQSCLMRAARPLQHNGLPCDKEQYHASLAYQSNGAYAASGSVSPRSAIVID